MRSTRTEERYRAVPISGRAAQRWGVGKNVLSNYLGTCCVLTAQLIAIPAYVRGLGERGWGTLSILVAASNALLMLEAGVSTAVARSFAPDSSGRADAFATILTLERRYRSAAATIIFLSVPPALWLMRPGRAPSDDHTGALVVLAASMAAFQIMGALYRSTLIGRGLQGRLNAVVASFAILRFGAAAAAATYLHSVEATAACLVCGFAAECLCRRKVALNALGRVAPQSLHGERKDVAPGATKLALASVLGALGNQMDRLILAARIGPAALGHYAIAATLSLAILQFVYPVSSALVPELQRFRGPKHRSILGTSYLLLVVLLSAVWLAVLWLPVDAIKVWLPGRDISTSVEAILKVHLIGTSLNALAVPLQLTLLANRLDTQIVLASISAFLVQVVSVGVLATRWGAVSGALAWSMAEGVLLSAYAFSYFSTKSRRHA